MKIFLSSTYIDLVQHRKAVDDIINRLCHQFRGMEYLGSRPFEPKKVCFDEISQCKIFIGVYAHRYGWIPEGNTLSITEQEFDFAQKIGLSCLCYIVNKEHPWSPKFIDTNGVAVKLRAFKESKVNNFVISEFTTPDNLAKQIAADINRTVTEDSKSIRTESQTIALLQNWCKQEIKTTVGPKYIRELHVARTVTNKIINEIKCYPRNLTKLISSFIQDAEAILNILEPIVTSEKLSDKIEEEYKETVFKFKESILGIKQYVNFDSTSSKICYPAAPLSETLNNILSIVERIRQNLNKYRIGLKNEEKISRSRESLLQYVQSIFIIIRPISLVIDRAGGGKTNVLCRLAEDLGEIFPTFFIAAKSIPEASETAIINYLSSVYPIGSDPVEVALDTIKGNKSFVLIIIDGINEHFQPKMFNAALKALIRRYYDQPIKYIFSCRDIYWNFFDDNWWNTHCSLTSRDELYQFRHNEFKKAFPKYLRAYNIEVKLVGKAYQQLHHPLLLRFFCEAFCGSNEEPTRMGTMQDIRLLYLFNSYCEVKYQQIKERLWLSSPAIVAEYVEMLGLMMLETNSRLLPHSQVRNRVHQQFGDEMLHSAKSTYVQILDEDIIIEQKPVGADFDLLIEFVYDEFMEYIIAKAKWSELFTSIESPTLEEDFKQLCLELFEREENFISVAGVIVFIGEMIASRSKKDGLNFVDWLIEKDRSDLACRIIVRWPEQTLEKEVFCKLIELHEHGENNEVKSSAWKALEEMYWLYWSIFFDYIRRMEMTGFYRPNRIFSLLARIGGGTTPSERLKTLQWIVEDMKYRKSQFLLAEESPDFRSAYKAVKEIINIGNDSWNKSERIKAEQFLGIAKQLSIPKKR